MKAIPIHQAKANLSKYIAEAKQGKPVYIGSFGKPEVMLSVIPKKQHSKQRDFAAIKGRFIASDDAFSEETEAEIAALLLGETDEDTA